MSFIAYLRIKLRKFEFVILAICSFWVFGWIVPLFTLNEDLAAWWVILYPAGSLVFSLIYADYKMWQTSIDNGDKRNE